ncbi:MAG: hypothetical protein IT367_20340 [Candidatus Hydrogenedentes bacterium]|nr:hypothetical protein [Candidatus Hydrogenedentota bacterium]
MRFNHGTAFAIESPLDTENTENGTRIARIGRMDADFNIGDGIKMEAQLQRQVRYQVQLGNEGKIIARGF